MKIPDGGFRHENKTIKIVGGCMLPWAGQQREKVRGVENKGRIRGKELEHFS